MKADIIKWRDKWRTGSRSSKYAMQVLTLILYWGLERGYVVANPAEAILEAGVSMNQALRYFDAVEKRVNQQLHPKAAVSASDTKPLLIPRGSSDRIHGKPANG